MVNVHLNINAYRTVITDQNQNIVIALDMSLQRHSYRYLDGALAKPLNSILYASVNDTAILSDLQELGREVERLLATRNIAADAAAALAGNQVVVPPGEDPLQASTDFVLGNLLHFDFAVPSGRTYRLDNVAMNRQLRPNHCYPIRGTDLWEGVTQAEFAAAASLRALELEMQAKFVTPQKLAEKFKSLQTLSPGERLANGLFKAISGARTQLAFAKSCHSTLGMVSRQPDIIKAVASIH